MNLGPQALFLLHFMPNFVMLHTIARFVRKLVVFRGPFSAPTICIPWVIEVIPYVLGAYMAGCFVSSFRSPSCLDLQPFWNRVLVLGRAAFASPGADSRDIGFVTYLIRSVGSRS